MPLTSVSVTEPDCQKMTAVNCRCLNVHLKYCVEKKGCDPGYLNAEIPSDHRKVVKDHEPWNT
jgi:hypothetical protein